MPSKDVQLLRDIQENIERVKRFIGSQTEVEFKADDKTFYSVVRALEIISEATRNLSDDVKGRHSSIDWNSIRNAGNVYRHAYPLVSEERVWDTATNHLDALGTVVLAELARLDK